MCYEVTMYRAKSGRTYETPLEALKDDLTQMVLQTADNLPIAEKLVAGIVENASAYSVLLIKIADKVAELPAPARWSRDIEIPTRTVQTDAGHDVFIGNDRIGYIENDRLHLIGADGYSHDVAECTHIDQVAGLVSQHYRAIP